MPRKSKRDLAKTWIERIDAAVAKHEEWFKQFKVEVGRLYFDGVQNPGVPEAEYYTKNEIYAQLEGLLPTLYSLDPYFYVRLKRSFSPNPMDIALWDQMGKTRQSMLNYLKGELDLKTKARLGILDAHFAYGVIKVHYRANEVENPEAGQPLLDDDEAPILGDDGDPLRQPETYPVDERYALTRIDPDDVIWGATDGTLPDKWTFIAERVRMSKAEAENHPLISKSRLKDIQTKSRDQDEKEKQGGNESGTPKEDEVYVFWEIYDLKAKQWLMLDEDKKSFVIEPRPLPTGVEDHPYAILRFTLRHKSPYPNTPVSHVVSPQRELNEARSKVLVHRKRFNRKYEAMAQWLGDDPDMELAKLESGEDGTVLVNNSPSGQRAVYPIQDAPLDPQTYMEIRNIKLDIAELMGLAPEQGGLIRAESATQASLLDQRLDLREGDRRSIIIDWLKVIASKLDQLVQANITRDEAVRITGPEGEAWKEIRSADYQDINGEYEYAVNVGATQPQIPALEFNQLMTFLQVVAAFPHVLTSPRLMKFIFDRLHIEDEQLIQELMSIGKQIVSGQVQPPGGGGGSQAGVAENNPITALGAALGIGNQQGADAT